MILVLADDLSGAAELAGVAHSQGLKAEVQTVFDPTADADLIAVDSDTRSRDAASAARILRELALRLREHPPAWTFKKVDSVLRGHITTELRTLLEVTGIPQVTLLSANPSRDRIIRDGHYYVEGVPLHQTTFAEDPDHPRRTSSVRDTLGLGSQDPDIQTPDVPDTVGLESCIAELGEAPLVAGSSDAFTALLRQRLPQTRPVSPTPPSEGQALWVCGSHAGWQAGRGEWASGRGITVVRMPTALFQRRPSSDRIGRWVAKVLRAFEKSDSVMMAIGEAPHNLATTPAHLLRRTATTVTEVLEQQKVATLYLEGGATARAIVDQLDLARFRIARELAPGTVAMLPSSREGPEVVVKPGSYDWPV